MFIKYEENFVHQEWEKNCNDFYLDEVIYHIDRSCYQVNKVHKRKCAQNYGFLAL